MMTSRIKGGLLLCATSFKPLFNLETEGDVDAALTEL